ncbi:FIVAR domain-containing protein [Bifidobacterium platyrrhinorum]|uniref:Sugar-binding protein n=1 Tax=Bifidobacterium platyrrhinorum TaxID=2661628 RepID=A0A6L9SRR9_9BIFI|nr:FIVAR domain-containing protein [Bifidobacterium platyrrhinorum]NEG55158.1 hypothetical protein [Bifidobacterium platyrrhinorum]
MVDSNSKHTPHDGGADEPNFGDDDAALGGGSLLNAGKDDDWDIPSLMFPSVDASDADGSSEVPAEALSFSGLAKPKDDSGDSSGNGPQAPSHDFPAVPEPEANAGTETAVIPVRTPVSTELPPDQPSVVPESEAPTVSVLPPKAAQSPDSGETEVIPPLISQSAALARTPVTDPLAKLASVGEAAGDGGGLDIAGTEDEPAGGAHGNGKGGEDAGSATKSRNRRPMVIAAVAAVAVIAVVAGVFAFRHHQRQSAIDTALAACQQAADDESKADDALAAALKKATAAQKITADQVADATTLSKLKSAVADAQGTVTTHACTATLTAAELNDHAKANSELAGTLSDRAKAVVSATDAVTASQEKKNTADIATAKQSLQTAVNDAQTLLTTSQGAVADDSTRQTLQAAVDAANTLLKDSKPKLAALKKALADIQSATTAVNESMSSYTASQNATQNQNQTNNGYNNGYNGYYPNYGYGNGYYPNTGNGNSGNGNGNSNSNGDNSNNGNGGNGESGGNGNGNSNGNGNNGNNGNGESGGNGTQDQAE